MRIPLAPIEILPSSVEHEIDTLEKLPYLERRHTIESEFPSQMYRYLSSQISDDFLADYLLDSFFWLSSPADLNDPFDMSAYVTLGQDIHKLRKKSDELIRRHNPTANWKTRRKIVSDMMCNPEKQQSLTKSAFENNIKKIGVLCFSEEDLNLLMWSHYADHHKGLVLQFDIAHDVRTMLRINKVDYSNEYPLIDWSEPTIEGALLKTVMRKHEGWLYEREWRMIIPNGAKTYLEFNPEAITRLIFGCRADIELKKKILNILQRRAAKNLSPINILCAVKHQKEYKLTVEEDHSLDWPS